MSLIALALGAAACAAGTSSSGPSWTALRHRLGVYGLELPAEVSAAAGLKVGLVLARGNATSSAILAAGGERMIDKSVQYDVYRGYASGKPLAGIERAVRGDVERGFRNPLVAGFYILDDPPHRHPNMLPALVYAHDLVMRLNRSTDLKRPTLCAFGATLDYRRVGAGRFAAPRGYLDVAIQNYSPSACDVAMLYAYGMNDRRGVAVQYDWRMTRLLPYFRSQLAARGFQPRRQLLVGIPQAWGEAGSRVHVPNADELATQTAAFCAGGASSIVAFAWRMSDSHYPHPVTLSNDPQLRQGLGAGYSACQREWASGAGA